MKITPNTDITIEVKCCEEKGVFCNDVKIKQGKATLFANTNKPQDILFDKNLFSVNLPKRIPNNNNENKLNKFIQVLFSSRYLGESTEDM